MRIEAVESHFVTVQGVDLHYVTAGPAQGKTVFLLHGFPEFWYGWRNQIEPLAEAGFRVVVPDQRGYNLSGKPRGVREYGSGILSADMLGLMDALGCEQVYLAGHDWGGLVAWHLAIHHPERVRRLAVLNAPHPKVMTRNLSHNPEQRRKSWYMLFFQLPLLPELLLRANRHANALRILKGSRSDAFEAEEQEMYRRAWSQPRAWTGMLNWYRAAMRRSGKTGTSMVEMPALVIWGEQDVALGTQMAAESLAFCRQGRLELVPDATHWVQHDAPERVSEWLVEFFGEEAQE